MSYRTGGDRAVVPFGESSVKHDREGGFEGGGHAAAGVVDPADNVDGGVQAGGGRGFAVGDWNSDGRLDLLVTNTNDRPELLENRLRDAHHWLGLRLHGARVNPFAIGARVTLTAGGLTLLREVRSGGSFLSQGDLRLHFGLGPQVGPVQVEVR